jgi:hypothetical protein
LLPIDIDIPFRIVDTYSVLCSFHRNSCGLQKQKTPTANLAGRRVKAMSFSREITVSVRRTISALTANSAVSADTKTVVFNYSLESWKPADFSCPVFGNGLNIGVAANLADMLYRSGEDPERFAAILAGKFGEIVCNQAIASLGIGKNQSKAETNFEKNKKLKTSFSVPRNWWEEFDSIRSIGLGILFNAQQGVRILFPEKIAPLKSGKSRFLKKQPYLIRACDSQSWEPEVYIANIRNSDMVDLIRRICSHNREQETTDTLECIAFPSYENLMIEKVLGGKHPGIGNRCLRVGKTVRVASNVVYSAFNAAAWRFLQFELGVGKRAVNSEIEEFHNNRDKRDVDRRVMLPDILREEMMVNARDKVDEMIIDICVGWNNGYSLREIHEEILSRWNYFGGSSPPSFSDFYRRHERIARATENRIRD